MRNINFIEKFKKQFDEFMELVTKEKIIKTVQSFLDLPLAPREREWDGAEAERRVRDWATTDGEIDFNKYRQAFMWWDNESPENLTSYKFGYADIIDGGLKAVPRGLLAVAAALQGGRTETTIPEADQERMKNVVSRYYKKMSEEFEDESIIAPWDVEKQTKVINKTKEMIIEKEYKADFILKEEEKQLIYGIVLEPGTTDSQGDVISTKEIEKAAHYFMEKSRTIGEKHIKAAEAKVVESYVAPDNFTLGGQEVLKGSWVMTIKVLDSSLWKDIKEGKFTGLSVGGYGTRREEA